MSYRSRLRQFTQGRFRVVALEAGRPDVKDWLNSPLGQAILAEEKAVLEVELQDLFGYHLLQMSLDPELNLTKGSRVGHRMTLFPYAAQKPYSPERLSPLVTEYDALPLPAEALDLVLVHHLLDYSKAPHPLLREAARVVIPRGHLIIVGFNSWSPMGILRWVASCFSRKARWRYRTLRLGRLQDWLQLLDFELVRVRHCFFRPPLPSARALKHLHWLERWGKKLHFPFGSAYVLVARKDIGAAIPLKPRWQQSPQLRGLGGIKPMRKSKNEIIQ